MQLPKKLGDVLKGMLPEIRQFAALAAWQDALDAELGDHKAPHCKVAGLRLGRLYVEVDSAPLFAELSGFQKETLRIALNERLKPKQVAHLVFRMGGTAHA